ncbi:MAG: helix-turn-helix domain-containing protein, partial [Gemmatimonadales bacterium]|nr:helix-turn-helix domain-containing protein [Gemmatimonadales bacterium]
GRCSVGEVADRLERKPESLYYHVKALREAGLVRRVGNRPGERRSETLYQAVAPEIVLDQGNRTP